MPAPPPADNHDQPDQQITLGFMFSHSIAGEMSRRLLALSADQEAMLTLLLEQGLLDQATFDTRRQAAYERLAQDLAQQGIGVFLNEEHPDKYALVDLPRIDCANRIHLCHAACCTLRFPLSRQDVEEGVVQWDYGRPYWNLRTSSGYCSHWQTNDNTCGVYAQRPGPCRVYDCREDKRIWADFEQMKVSAELAAFFQ